MGDADFAPWQGHIAGGFAIGSYVHDKWSWFGALPPAMKMGQTFTADC